MLERLALSSKGLLRDGRLPDDEVTPCRVLQMASRLLAARPPTTGLARVGVGRPVQDIVGRRRPKAVKGGVSLATGPPVPVTVFQTTEVRRPGVP